MRVVVGVALAMLLAFAGLVVAAASGAATNEGRFVLTQVDGATAIVLEGGAATTSELQASAAVEHRSDHVLALRANLVIAPGATLEIADTTLRLAGLDDTGATITVRGTLELDRSRVTPTPDVADTHTEVVVERGGRLVGTATDFERLGWEDAHPGLLVGPGGRAAIHGGAMRGNHHGVTARGAERVDLRDVTVARSRGTGILLRGPCGTVALRGVVSRENAASGVKIDDACTGVAIDGASVNRNARSGIDVADSDGVSVRRAQVWDNETGVVLRGAAHATLAGSQVSANRSDGVLVNAPAGGVRVLRGRLDHNARAGIYLNQGQATVGRRTRIVSNETGVRVTDPTVVVSVADSLVTRNVKDGFSLVGAGGVTLTRNRVLDNGAAAFSVDVPGESAPLLAGNRIDDAVTERVRSPETDPP